MSHPDDLFILAHQVIKNFELETCTIIRTLRTLPSVERKNYIDLICASLREACERIYRKADGD